MLELLTIEGNCSCVRAKAAHFVGHLPVLSLHHLTGGTSSKEGQGESLQRETGLPTHGIELLQWQRSMHFHHTMAGVTCQMIMIIAATDTVAMGSISKGDPIKNAMGNEQFNHTIEGCSTQMRSILTEFTPEIIHGKIGPIGRIYAEMVSDKASRTRVSLAYLMKDGIDALDELFCSLLLL
jgi:hypothetical protein